jgi:hypothetical protein
MEKQDILIRLLKDGHISESEFKLLYEYVPNELIPFNPYIYPVITLPQPYTVPC